MSPLGFGEGAQELVELPLVGGLLATLCVLDDEQHHQRDRRRPGLEADEPSGRKADERADHDSTDHRAHHHDGRDR